MHIHRTGPVNPKAYPVKLTANAKVNNIQVGDLVAFELNTGVEGLIPVTSFVWNTDEQTTSRAFAVRFAGISSGRSLVANTLDTTDKSILVVQDGEVEFDCDSAAYQVDALLKPKKAAGNSLLQTMIVTTDAASAIARVSATSVGTVTRIRAYLLKTPPKRNN